MKFNLQHNSEQPLYVRLTQELRRQMKEGVLSPGDRLPSFAELREQHGLHKNTIERAYLLLEQDGLVVREQGRGTFVAQLPHNPAVKGVIGFCGMQFLLSSTSPYWTQLLSGVHEVLQQHNLQLLLLESNTPDLRDKVDGALINTSWNDPLQQWHDDKWPCVGLLLPSRTMEISSVVADDYAGQRQATQHLLELGHRRIAYLHSRAAQYLVPHRRAGYLDALQASGVQPDKRWVRSLMSQVAAVDFRQTGRESMAAWLREDWNDLGCTALMAHNDEAAVGVIEALQEAGLRVPEDVSVVGFDGTELCEYSRPRLTTVEVPLREIGRTATHMLLQRIYDNDEAVEHLTLPVAVRVRESSAPPGTENAHPLTRKNAETNDAKEKEYALSTAK